MKKQYLLTTILFFLFFIPNLLKSQIKIGDNPNTINAASLLELESTTKGVLFPRMNTTQMNALTAI